MFHKSHLQTNKAGSFDPDKQLTKANFSFFPGGVLVRVRWNKTIQFRERVVQIPLLHVPDSIFCPVPAISHAFSFTNTLPPTSQAFRLVHSSLVFQPFTYGLFLAKLCACPNKCCLHGMDFGSHSFCQGGGLHWPSKWVYPWNSLKFLVTGSPMQFCSTSLSHLISGSRLPHFFQNRHPITNFT